MSERAHPDDPGFQMKWKLHFWKGIIPWMQRHSSPYRDAFLWRHSFVNEYCTGLNVLDIPCGMGWGTSLLTECRSVTGIDISYQAIEEAKSRYGVKAQFVVGNMDRLCFPERVFDLICCLEGIEHVSGEIAKAFITECHRVLHPKGLLIISSPHCATCAHSGNPHHVKEYMPEELKDLLNPFFEIISQHSRPVDNMIVSIFVAEKRP